MFVLVSPNNPTGAVTPPDVIREIADLADHHDLLIIADEIYAKMIYAPNEHLSIATLPGMKERTVTLNGFSKTYAMTGWRVGYLAAPARLRRQGHRAAPHALDQHLHHQPVRGAGGAHRARRSRSQAMLAEYAERRAWLMPALTEAGFTYGHPGGAFYIYTNIASTGMPAPEFCERLLRETGVMLFPGTMFGDDEHRLHPHQLPAAAAA